MASSLFLNIFLLISFSHFLTPTVYSATVVEDLESLTPPSDFVQTICLREPSLPCCTNASTDPNDILQIFRSTIVASHLCNESKNPNCNESFPTIRIHNRPRTAVLYLSFDFFWKYCPSTIVEIEIVNNSLNTEFPTNVLSCTQVRTLDLSFNQFTGLLPVQNLSGLHNITRLNISYNRFSESPISDTDFLHRFNVSSFIESGVLTNPNMKRNKIMGLIFLIMFPLMVSLLCFCCGWVCVKRPDYLPRICRRSKHKFTSAMLEAATNDFSNENLVSANDGVDVYKGVLRNGTEAKIEVFTEKVSREKRLEFVEECKMLFKLRHKNLVRVLGWCNDRNLRALVTEWSDGENVETWLSSSSSSALSWKRRLRVVMGIVEGICYLADQWPEITFDLSTSNVLLSDHGREPLISEFEIRDGNNTATNIYKFGMFLLEMITNLRPDYEQEDSERRYLEYIRVHYPDNLERVIDEKMKIEERMLEKVEQAITLGLMCTEPPVKQPTLEQIYELVVSLYDSTSRNLH